MDIGPGDVVICVSSLGPPKDWLVVGRRYVVSEIGRGMGTCVCHTKAISPIMVEGHPPVWLCPLNFTKRPPERTELFRSLLENPKILEDA